MLINHSKNTSLNGSLDKKPNQRANLNQTPSKKSKYDSFTPRKRYMKEHDEYDNYRNFQFQPAEPYHEHAAFHFEAKEQVYSRNSNGSVRKRQSFDESETRRYHFKETYPQSFEKIFPTESRPPLNQYSVKANCPTSIRQAKFKNYATNQQICKKISFDQTQNRDRSNLIQGRSSRKHIEAKQRFLDIESQPCLTPRRLSIRKEENMGEVNEKLSLIQAKIARLERMTPKRCSTPKASRLIETVPEFNNQPNQKQEIKPESTVSSRVSVISERQNEIMSRVSLGRLVEQQECQTEMEVIQDLSYKISSKLRSIIRNFG